jgi:O-antigen/teichoic acid export membrane protein
MLVGRYLGSAALGFYSVAYNVMFSPISRLVAPIQSVLVPAFSRMQEDPERLGRAWLRGSRLMALVAFPAFAGMIVVAPDFVPVVFGSRWNDAVPVVRFLCIAGAVQTVQTLQHSLLQARGQVGMLFRLMTVSCVLNVAAFALGLRWGIAGVAAFFAASRVAMLPVLTYFTTREIGLRPADLARGLGPVIASASLMTVVVLGSRRLLIDAGMGAPGRVAILIAVGIAAYSLACYVFARDVAIEFRRVRSGA